MKQIKVVAILLVFPGLTSFQENQLPKAFTDLLDRSKMIFEKPEGLNEIAPIENEQMNYEYVLKYPDRNFEVRYAVRPLDLLIKEYEESMKNKKEGEIMLHPNKYYSPLMQATVLNISGGDLPEISAFDNQAVKKSSTRTGVRQRLWK